MNNTLPAFMCSDYKGDNPYPTPETTRAAEEARKRGTCFAPDQLKAILAIWADAAEGGQVRHGVDRLIIPGKNGAAIIQPHRISFEAKEPSAEQMRASMQHIAERWNGEAGISLNASRSFRLQARAYAEVYGVKISDPSESFLHESLTKDELAKLPAMREAIRKTHADAPPKRPDEEKALAAMYHARNPFMHPAPA